MSQPTTALLAGIEPEGALAEFLRSDEGDLFRRTQGSHLRWDCSRKCVGIPFAVAHDPPEGCAELEFPLRVRSLGNAYNEDEISLSWLRAIEEWGRISRELRSRGLEAPMATMILTEIERP